MSRRYEIESIGPATLLDRGGDLRSRASEAVSRRQIALATADFFYETLAAGGS